MNQHRFSSGATDDLTDFRGHEGIGDIYARQISARSGERSDELRAKLLFYVGLALKHRYLAIVIVGVFLCGGVFVTARTPKVFSAVTSIKIDRSVPQVIKDQAAQPDSANDDAGFYETQYELIRSRALAERVAKELNLVQSDFLEAPQPSLASLLIRWAGGGQEMDAASDAATLKARQVEATAQIMAGLSIQPVGQSAIVKIRYASTNPAWAQRISVAAAEQFQKMTLDMRFAESNYARDFLNERLEELKLKLENSERQLIAYAQKQGIADVDNQQPQAMEEYHGVETAYSNAVTKRVALEETSRQAEGSEGDSLPQIMSDPNIQSTRLKLAQLKANYDDKLRDLRPDAFSMIALKSQIGATEKDLQTQIGLIKDSIKKQFEEAKAIEAALKEKLEKLKAEALDLRARSVDYTILMREVDTNRTLYDGLLQQFRTLGVASDAESNNVSVLDRAQLPTVADSPSLSANLLWSLLLGLAAAAGVIWLIETLDDSHKTPQDIEQSLGQPVLGVIPLYRDPQGERTALGEVTEDPSSRLAEAYRSLRTAVQFSTSDGAPRSLMLTSARPGEGKTTTAICLGINFAKMGLRVLLVDADLRNPSIHTMLEINNSFGLSNYLSGAGPVAPEDGALAADAASLVRDCQSHGIFVLPSGPLPPNPAELLSGPKFSRLLSAAERHFDIVLIDGPPIMGLADAPILGSLIKGSLLVVEAGRTRRAVVRDSLKRLQFARARMVGCVLNKFHPKYDSASYGYDYGWGYEYARDYAGGGERQALAEGVMPRLRGRKIRGKPRAEPRNPHVNLSG